MTRTYATLGTDGILATDQRPAGLSTPVHGEQFAGDGVTTAFTLAHTPIAGIDAFIGGIRQDPSLVGAIVTFTLAPALSAAIRISYEY